MGELVFMQNGQALTNSLLVAEKFRKEHKNIMRDIRNLVCAQNRAETENQQLNSMFVVSEYETPLNNGTDAVRKDAMYIMNRDGFTLLVMGFTGEKALRFKLEYIAAFNRMEKQLQQSLLPAERVSQLQEVLSLKDTIIENQNQIIHLMEKLYSTEEQKNMMTPTVTVIDEKSSIVGRSTRRRAMLTEYENLERFADVFFRNEDNFAHPVSKNEMMHLYIKFCGLEPSKQKMNAIKLLFNKMIREYCLNAGIVVNPPSIFSSGSDCREGYIRRPAYETEYKFGVPTVPEQRLLKKVARCYYFYHKGDVPQSPQEIQPANGKEGLL